jgi:hypothetical protein
MSLVDSLLAVARDYSEATGLSLATVATAAANDGKFFARIARGAGLTTRRYECVMLWFSERWPQDLPWPENADRPNKAAREAATPCSVT